MSPFTLSAVIIAVTLSLRATTTVHAGAPDEPGIPPNIVVAPILRSAIETMWRQSPTFKAQCARLRGVPLLLVDIRFGNPSQLGGARARTDFIRSSRDTARADIHIDPSQGALRQLVELIAHELEHVIEQLDDVELRPDDRQGVFRTASGALETARAIRVGLKVKSECRLKLP